MLPECALVIVQMKTIKQHRRTIFDHQPLRSDPTHAGRLFMMRSVKARKGTNRELKRTCTIKPTSSLWVRTRGKIRDQRQHDKGQSIPFTSRVRLLPSIFTRCSGINTDDISIKIGNGLEHPPKEC